MNFVVVLGKIETLMTTWFGGMTGVSSGYAWLMLLGYAVGASIGLVFAWWGIRKVVSIIMGAFRNGHLKM